MKESKKMHKRLKHKDSMQRMNYLIQAAALQPSFSAYYHSLALKIKQKTTLRLDSSIKRMICKRCKRLITGFSLDKSIKTNPGVEDGSKGQLKFNFECICGFTQQYLLTKELHNDINGKDI
jgi:RNase P subunit RPR2